YEYMAAKRPVISVMAGDIERCELGQIVEKTKIGMAYEASNHKEDYPKLREYIKRQYDAFVEKGRTLYEPDPKELRRYDYRYLCKRLIRIMDK
ncbi:MAG: hypothetical protein K2I53_13900, partial [Lachnospiraceae bacterium]|nr:hypothetical protein [Lachnospiraceae bacterium]